MKVSGVRGAVARLGVIALAAVLMTALDVPRLLILDDPGAAPALAKNDRSSERSQGGRGRGNGGRGDRSVIGDEDRGRPIWNRPRGRDHAGDDRPGRPFGSRGSDGHPAFRAASVPLSPPLPPHRPDPDESGFRNHGDRVSTFVDLAKELGFNASVGAMQANFGTPFENGLVATDPETGAFLKDPDSGAFIIDASEAEIAAVKPGGGPRTGWETETDLDVNMDGLVDATDLALARDGGVSSDGDGEPDDPAYGGHDQTAIRRLGREDGVSAP